MKQLRNMLLLMLVSTVAIASPALQTIPNVSANLILEQLKQNSIPVAAENKKLSVFTGDMSQLAGMQKMGNLCGDYEYHMYVVHTGDKLKGMILTYNRKDNTNPKMYIKICLQNFSGYVSALFPPFDTQNRKDIGSWLMVAQPDDETTIGNIKVDKTTVGSKRIVIMTTAKNYPIFVTNAKKILNGEK